MSGISINTSEEVIINIKEGKIRGTKEKSDFSGTEFYSFYGIPYGKPPMNDLRFRDPIEAEPFDGVYDATTAKPGCAQFSLRRMEFTGDEDCLYLNIYTPGVRWCERDGNLRAVVVAIHPGGFSFGTANPSDYGSGDFVMHNDVVYVCISFRLHILGFLNLGLKDCGGNQGLKDIILALKWINKNIKNFLGDPQNITLLGSSSGSEAVHLLMLSPAANGLFHKAVMMGTYAFNPALYRRYRDEGEKAAFHIARELGYDGADGNSLLSFLRSRPVRDIIKLIRPYKHRYMKFADMFASGIFSPTVDEGEGAILPMPFDKFIPFTARIPIMYGICERESVLGFCTNETWRKNTEKYLWASFRQNRWGWGYKLNDNDVNAIAKRIESFYLNGNSLTTAPLSVKEKIQTHIGYSSVYDTLIDVVSADLPSSVFVYKFEFEGNLYTIKDRIGSFLEEPLEGTFHAADYEFWARIRDPCGVCDDAVDEKTREYVNTFTALISTFAKSGDPNYRGFQTRWKPSSPRNPCYLAIRNPPAMVDGRLNDDGMKFWDDVKQEFRRY